MSTPTNSKLTTQHSKLTADARQLRHLIRDIRRRMNHGQLDNAQGGLLISRLYHSLSHLLRTQHRITSPQDGRSQRLHDELQRVLRELDLEG